MSSLKDLDAKRARKSKAERERLARMTLKEKKAKRAYDLRHMRALRVNQRAGIFTERQIKAFYSYCTDRDPETGCIGWVGAYSSRAKGMDANRPMFQGLVAAKIAWLIHELESNGEPTPWEVDEEGLAMETVHWCRNAICVNWEHIYPMTHEEHDAYDGRNGVSVPIPNPLDLNYLPNPLERPAW